MNRLKVCSIRCLFFCLCFLGCFSTGASQERFDEKSLALMQRILDDKGEGWICEWKIVLPDGLPGATFTQNVSGLRGLSTVSVDQTRLFDIINANRILVNSFLDDYVLPIVIGYDGLVYATQDSYFCNLIGQGHLAGKSGFISQISKKPDFGSDYLKISNSAFEEDSEDEYNRSDSFSSVYIDENTVEIHPSHDFGFLIAREWDSKPIDLHSTTNIKMSADIIYASDIRFVFHRVGKIDYAVRQETTAEGQTKTVTYPVLINSGSGNEAIVSGMYGRGTELDGNILGFSLGKHSVNPSEFALRDKESLSSPTSRALRLRPLLYQIYSTSTIDFAEMINEEYIHYTDYAVMSEEEYRALDIQTINSDNALLSDFQTKLASGGFTSPQVRVNGQVNAHWDRPSTTVNSDARIVIDRHVLVPVYYKYSYWSSVSKYMSTHFEIGTDAIMVDNIKIGETDSNADEISPNLSFELTDYGNGRISDEDPEEYLYIKGKLNSDRDDIKLFIVAGTIDGYASEELADNVNGHVHGISIEKFAFTEEAKALAAQDVKQVRYLIPKSEINTFDANDSEEYTLYAKYTSDSGASRFRTLATLSDVGITTVVDKIQPCNSEKEPGFEISGNRITVIGSNAETVTIYDILGRHCHTLFNGQSAILYPGTYVVTVANHTSPPISHRISIAR